MTVLPRPTVAVTVLQKDWVLPWSLKLAVLELVHVSQDVLCVASVALLTNPNP